MSDRCLFAAVMSMPTGPAVRLPIRPPLLLLGVTSILVTPGADLPYPALEGEGRT
ncbi:hypothetical protein [Neorhizobium sp. DAR64860/K0K1]|uniref:hypothetical protein n=1 Tax=Neorhizobium sp. DAR64860/K0K1 TaxID=3421955 RepID=UPI003D2795EF